MIGAAPPAAANDDLLHQLANTGECLGAPLGTARARARLDRLRLPRRQPLRSARPKGCFGPGLSCEGRQLSCVLSLTRDLQREISVPYTNKLLIEQGLALLTQAQQAATRGDAHGMIEALAASGYLDGLVGRLTARWGKQIGPAELTDIVADSVDKAFEAITHGKPVTNLGGWLLKVAENAANDRWKQHHKGRVDVAEIDGNYRRPAPITDSERTAIDGHADRCRDEAVAIARRLLPKVGEGQIREVMALVIDAVEQGVPDLPAAQIAATLSIGEDSVRTLLSRGFRRLRRAAADEGVAWPDDLELEEPDDIEALHKHVREQEDDLDAE